MRESIATPLRALLIAFAVALPIAASELLLRARFAETAFVPGAHMRAVQQLLALHPEVGFLWKPDIRVSDHVLLPWNDQVVEPLSTDGWGFRNAPAAIAWLDEGRPVDVVGLGDSFMHDASGVFAELFATRGLFYYSLAMHRHSPPQYTRILDAYAVALKPFSLVYGLYENDFREARDFHTWERSGLDWFEYHSGTWAGPPIANGAATRFVRRHFPGSYGFYRDLTREGRARREAELLAAEGPAALREEVLRAAGLAREHGIRLLVVLIPGKRSALEGATPEFVLLELLARQLRGADLRVLDLLPILADPARDPESLYYRVDSHWNARGMQVAGEAILDSLAASSGGGPDQGAVRGASKGPRALARREARSAALESPARR